MLSGIQHFCFCRRQWALIDIEQLWAENQRTAEGEILHERAHDTHLDEKRGDLLVVRGLRVFSPSLGVSGACDVVEFSASPDGVSLAGRSGQWAPFPIEYKRGVSKQLDADRLQLCCQAMCLEEMLCCSIPAGALYYGETRRREAVPLGPELRAKVREMLCEMHALAARGHTPRVRPGKHCGACSLKELCLPQLCTRPSVQKYIRSHMEDAPCDIC